VEGYSELVDIATTGLSRADTFCTLSHIDRESYGSKGKVKVFWVDDLLLALRQVKFLYEWVRGKSIQNLLTKGKDYLEMIIFLICIFVCEANILIYLSRIYITESYIFTYI